MESVATLDPVIAARFKSLELLIGNTPLLAIHLRCRGEARTVYAKYEQVNMTGSIKDRMALYTSCGRRTSPGRSSRATPSRKRPAATPASPSPPWAVRWGIP